MITEFLRPQLDGMDLNDMWFQQDGATCHTAHETIISRNCDVNYVGSTESVKDGELRFEPELYNKRLELKSTGRIHCKTAGGTSPTIQWFLNKSDPLPDGITSVNGTLLIAEAKRHHKGAYTCVASNNYISINTTIQLDIVVSPRISMPAPGEEVHVIKGDDVWLDCIAQGDPQPKTQWDRNTTALTPALEGVQNEDSEDAEYARIILMNNGTLALRNVSDEDTNTYGCTAGSLAGLARNELTLIVHPEGTILPNNSSGGVAGKAVVVSVSVAVAYMLLVLALMLYCRRRRMKRRQRDEKMELEMAEGREKLVEEGDEKHKGSNGAAPQNGRLLTHERDSGADNSEVSAASRVSKRSGQYDHIAIPRTMLSDQIALGRGEFGDVMLAKLDVNQVKRSRSGRDPPAVEKPKPVLVISLTTKDENLLLEFRRTLEMFARVKDEHVCRLVGLVNDSEPHYLVLEHTDWGDLKQFLSSTRTDAEREEYLSRVGPSASADLRCGAPAQPLLPSHRAVLALHLARAGAAFANFRQTHRDIAARNCMITSKLQLKLSCPALTRGPHSHEYYKLHDKVIPLRWLPVEAVMESDYSTKSDVYMFAVTVWEIYTKAELPFAKLNDNSVMDRIKNGTLEWTVPESMPDRLADLLKKCWSKSMAERPLFDAVCEEMTVIVKEVTAENLVAKSQENLKDNQSVDDI